MKKVAILAFLLVVPTLFFLNVHQSVRFEQLHRSAQALEEAQESLLEKNKRAIAAIEVLTSPRRLEELARRDLGLVKLDRDRFTTVTIRRENGDE